MAFLLLLTTVLYTRTRTRARAYTSTEQAVSLLIWALDCTRLSNGYSTLNLSLTVPMTANAAAAAAAALAFLSRKWMFAVAPLLLLLLLCYRFVVCFAQVFFPYHHTASAVADVVMFLGNIVLFLFYFSSVRSFSYIIHILIYSFGRISNHGLILAYLICAELQQL